jgi:hypothetical protein
MTLPCDYARCSGHEDPVCRNCERGSASTDGCYRVVWLDPPPPVDGKCEYKITKEKKA